VNRALRVDELPERCEFLAKSRIASSRGFSTGSGCSRIASIN
jgi:hypothetical protein